MFHLTHLPFCVPCSPVSFAAPFMSHSFMCWVQRASRFKSRWSKEDVSFLRFDDLTKKQQQHESNDTQRTSSENISASAASYYTPYMHYTNLQTGFKYNKMTKQTYWRTHADLLFWFALLRMHEQQHPANIGSGKRDWVNGVDKIPPSTHNLCLF